jgi:hypothetical protein
MLGRSTGGQVGRERIMAKAVLPRVHVMLLCDEIESVAGEEDVSNLLGVRTPIKAATFPHVHPRLRVYLPLTGHEGTVSGAVAIVNGRTDQEVSQVQLTHVVLQDPLTIVTVTAAIEDCEFPEPGVYYLQAYFEGKLLSERLFHPIESQGTTNGRERT